VLLVCVFGAVFGARLQMEKLTQEDATLAMRGGGMDRVTKTIVPAQQPPTSCMHKSNLILNIALYHQKP
jgi:hypothetical protein